MLKTYFDFIARIGTDGGWEYYLAITIIVVIALVIVATLYSSGQPTRTDDSFSVASFFKNLLSIVITIAILLTFMSLTTYREDAEKDEIYYKCAENSQRTDVDCSEYLEERCSSFEEDIPPECG